MHVYGDIIDNNEETSMNLGIQKVDEYAVNGAIWYAQHLKDDFDVIAIGISGNNIDNLIIDTFVWNKEAESFNNLNIHEIVSMNEYRKLLDEQKKEHRITSYNVCYTKLLRMKI